MFLNVLQDDLADLYSSDELTSRLYVPRWVSRALGVGGALERDPRYLAENIEKILEKCFNIYESLRKC